MGFNHYDRYYPTQHSRDPKLFFLGGDVKDSQGYTIKVPTNGSAYQLQFVDNLTTLTQFASPMMEWLATATEGTLVRDYTAQRTRTILIDLRTKYPYLPINLVALAMSIYDESCWEEVSHNYYNAISKRSTIRCSVFCLIEFLHLHSGKSYLRMIL